MTGYADFLARKQRAVQPAGCAVDESDVHPMLHPWQKRIVAWSVRLGRAAVWADTGLGKTFLQVETVRLSGDRGLIIAPLAVCAQTVREAAKLGVTVRYARSDADAAGPGTWITNYEMAERFDPAGFDVVALDEASILKQSDGATRTMLVSRFADVKRRFTYTATPAPNDN